MNTPVIARVKIDFIVYGLDVVYLHKNTLIKILEVEEKMDYDDFGNGDIIVFGYDTSFTFEIHKEVKRYKFRGRLTDVAEILPDTPAVRILYGERNEHI